MDAVNAVVLLLILLAFFPNVLFSALSTTRTTTLDKTTDGHPDRALSIRHRTSDE
jgi:hypothetical protein